MISLGERWSRDTIQQQASSTMKLTVHIQKVRYTFGQEKTTSAAASLCIIWQLDTQSGQLTLERSKLGKDPVKGLKDPDDCLLKHDRRNTRSIRVAAARCPFPYWRSNRFAGELRHRDFGSWCLGQEGWRGWGIESSVGEIDGAKCDFVLEARCGA